MDERKEKLIETLYAQGKILEARELILYHIINEENLKIEKIETETEKIIDSKVAQKVLNAKITNSTPEEITKSAGQGYQKYTSTKSGPATDEQIKKLDELWNKLSATVKTSGWKLFEKTYQLEALKKLTTKQVGAAITGLEKFTAGNAANNSQVEKKEPVEIENL